MYYLVFAITMVASFIKKINAKILLMLVSIVLFVMAAFRYGVGADYFAYKYLFSRYMSSPILELTSGTDKKEIAFRLFGSMFRMVGANYQIFIAVIAIVILVFLYFTCKRYSKRPVMSLFIYYSLFYLVWIFSGYRQGLVLAIGVFALLRFQKKQDMWKFLLITFALSFLHLSALILVAYYFLAKIKWNNKRLVIMLVMSLAVAFIPLGQLVLSLSGLPIFDKIVYYIGGQSYGIDFFVKIVPRIVFAICAIYFYSRSKKAVNDNNKSIYFIIGMCMYFVFASIETLASRTSIFGFVFIILLIPDYLTYIQKNYSKIIYNLLCFAVIIFSFIFLLKNINTLRLESDMSCPGDYSDVFVPYTNVFDNQKCEFMDRYYKLTDGKGL